MGTFGSGDGQLKRPHGVGVDSAGNIYVGDTDNNRIQKFDNSGTYLGQWGATGTGDGQFRLPKVVKVDSDGSAFVADQFNHLIQKFDSNGAFKAKWGGYGPGDPDTFRIRIWTEDPYGNESTVYDNGSDQAIGGGQIIVNTR